MESRRCYVYRHRRLDNNQIFYVGIGTRLERVKCKECKSRYSRAYNTHRNQLWHNVADSKEYKIEIVADNLTKEEAEELEIFLISLYGRIITRNGVLTNLTEGGHILSEEDRVRMVESRRNGKGYAPSEETRQKISIANTGKKRSEEVRAACRERKGSKNPNFGRIRSEEWKKSHSINQRIISTLAIRIIDKNTLKIYQSNAEAADEYGINRRTLYSRLTGKVKNKTSLIYLKDFIKTMTQEELQKIDLREYVYETGQMISIEIPGRLIEGLLDFFDNVQRDHTYYGIADTYSKSAKEVKDKDGKIEKIELNELSYPTPDSYFSQKPQQFRDLIGAYSLDLLLQFKQIHLDLIQKGEAKKVGTIVNKPEIKLA